MALSWVLDIYGWLEGPLGRLQCPGQMVYHTCNGQSLEPCLGPFMVKVQRGLLEVLQLLLPAGSLQREAYWLSGRTMPGGDPGCDWSRCCICLAALQLRHL